MRTDGTSTEIIDAGTTFTSGTWIWSDPVNLRDYSDIAIWFTPTDLGSNTQVDIVLAWSDDGSTIPFGDDDSFQQSDFKIANGSDGTFTPVPYTARLTTAAGGGLVTDTKVHLAYPKRGGWCRVGVKGNHASGAFGVRAMRLVL